MRVTPQVQVARTIRNLQRVNARLSKYQDQVSSQKRLSKASDDPSDFVLVRRGRTADTRYETDKAAMLDASFLLEHQVQSLSEMRELLTEAASIAIDVNDGSKQSPHAEVSAVQLEQILDRALALANTTTSDGRSLFAGTSTDARAFAVTNRDANGRPTRFAYQGADQASEAVIGTDQNVKTFISGRDVFGPSKRGNVVIYGSTGAKAGSNTSNSTGKGELTVRMTSTFLGGSGLSSGASSSVDRDVLGLGSHTITISNNGTELSLNGGPTVAHNGSTDFVLKGLNGEQVVLNTNAVLVDGTYNIIREGELSTDGGKTFTAMTSPVSQEEVVNSVTGEITYIDTTAIRSSGTDIIDNQGAYDVFQTISALRDAVRDLNSVPNTERAKYLSRMLQEMESLREKILTPLGAQSASAEQIKDLTTRIEDRQLDLATEIDGLEATDVPRAITNLQFAQSDLESVLAVTGRFGNLSLIDYLA